VDDAAQAARAKHERPLLSEPVALKRVLAAILANPG